MKVGDKVSYVPFYGGNEKGIVKEIIDKEYAFVVYSCNGDWKNYSDYTGERSNRDNLIMGWGDAE